MPVVNGGFARIALQVFLVVFLSICSTYAIERLNLIGHWNFVGFILGISIIVYIFNTNRAVRVFMFISLCVLSLIVVGFTGYVLGYAG